jgi:hypothetical protein
LLGILAVTFVTLLLAAVGVISWPLQIVVDVIPVAFCLHLRAQARRAVAVARQRRRVAVASDVPAPTPAAARWSMPTPSAAAPATAAPVEEQPAAATGTDDRIAAEVADATDETVTWEPVPVPRPTYTMKPPAPAYEADPTYAPPVYASDPEPVDSGVDPGMDAVVRADGETDLDEILERRWAVND